jgi:predicted 3-demethylubiquinone-9 3-methyltransferase (glyoxalase superfamily)
MNNFQENIDHQLAYNQGKNLFYQGILQSLRFSPETLAAIKCYGEITDESENLLIDYSANRALEEFCRVNQYYTFDKQAREALKAIYTDLFANLKTRKIPVEAIAEKHYGNLANWLAATNAFAEKVYATNDQNVEPVACSEYSSELQVEILKLDVSRMLEPVLDIGCGKEGNLVLHLRNCGIEAYGFDRFAFTDSFLTHSNWFEFEFKTGQWGTIVSNLGFSNHFKHHHLRNDGNFIGYAQKYMEILNALKVCGSFHYAPDLPFVEQYLDETKYHLTRQSIGNYDFKSVIIKRLK